MRISIIVALLIPLQSMAQIDFTSVDAFWVIHDKIKFDAATDADWDKLFETPYYKFYNNWGQRKYMRRMLISAYSPSKQRARDSLLQLSNWDSEIIKHLLTVDTLKDELLEYRDMLRKKDLEAESLVKVKPWLPASFVVKSDQFPLVAFGIFQPDGHADESVAMDLRKAMTIDVSGFMAHEAHHFYTFSLRKKIKEDEKDSTYLLLKTIGQLQLEGIADMIDKDDFLKSGGKGQTKSLYDKYVAAFNDPLPALRKVDSLLVYISKHPASTKENSKLINGLLPLAGHPHGYYMAKTIVRRSGTKALTDTIDNPFKFLVAFNRASGEFRFSKTAMDFLSKLERNNVF